MRPLHDRLNLIRRPAPAIVRGKFKQIGTHDRDRESTIGIRHHRAFWIGTVGQALVCPYAGR